MSGNVRPESLERIVTEKQALEFIDDQVKELQQQIGDGKVLLALSGGVDSSVVAALLIKAIGKQLTCVHVNHGLLRKGEPEQVIEVFRNQMDIISSIFKGSMPHICAQARKIGSYVNPLLKPFMDHPRC